MEEFFIGEGSYGIYCIVLRNLKNCATKEFSKRRRMDCQSVL